MTAVFVIEGPDGAGKTTFATQLSDTYREMTGREATRLHASKPGNPPADPFDEYELGLLSHLRHDDPEGLVICDRWCLGETIYGPLMRGSSRLSSGGILHAELMLASLGAAQVIMLPSLGVIKQRIAVRGDLHVTLTDLTKLYFGFTHAYDRYNYELIRQVPSPDTIFSGRIAAALLNANLARLVRDNAPDYVGSLTPVVVFAGDERAGDHPLAFTPASRSGCAWFMLESLCQTIPSMRWFIKHAGMLNTGEPGVNLKDVDRIFGCPRWVALGRRAESRLHDAGIHCAYVPHPQWARRFKHHENYGTRLLEAAGSLSLLSKTDVE